ncbi:uncharacterized protein LOC141660071 [Apium graveolens]|uniref:uncharacterized protein LOC141660071 n=1 Tax=Apium graveolens TaxID=4045 RepID=UPI003D7AD978
MEELCSKLNFEGFIAVEPQEKSGGIAMFWQDAEKVTLLSFSKNHIDILINMGDNKEWRLIGIYGEPSRTQRFKTWELLRNLSRDANLPWCLIGDFNNVTSQDDKRGAAYPNNLIEGFNECLLDVELHDLDIIGHQYTWERGKSTENWIEIQLDRVFVNMQWSMLYQMAKVYNLEGSLLGTKHIIKDQWEEDIHYSVSQKVKKCADSLDIWGREITSCFGKRIKECKIKLNALRQK